MGCQSDSVQMHRHVGNSDVILSPGAPVASGTSITLTFPGDYPGSLLPLLIGATGAMSYGQGILTTSTPQFARLGLGAAADATIPLYCPSGIWGLGENVNSFMDTGVHINQGGSDKLFFCGASTDVTHGVTSSAPTGAFVTMQKYSAGQGGLKLETFTEGTVAFNLDAIGTSDNTTKTTAGLGYATILAAKKTGTTWGACGDDANLLVVRDASTTVLLVDKEGQLHINEASADGFPTIDMKQSSTGDVGIRFGCGSTTSAMAGLDNSLTGDPYVIAFANSATAVLGTGDVFHLTSAGNLGIGLGNSVAPATRLDIGAGALTLLEMTAPGAGAANTARIYAEDNGSGKTRLMVQFATGAAQQIAIEP